MHSNLTGRIWCASIILCLVGSGLENTLWGQDVDDARPLLLSSTPTKDQILIGEPLFINLLLRNDGKEKLQIRNLRENQGIGQLFMHLQIARGDGDFREIELFQTSRSTIIAPPVASLAAGQVMTDCFTVWFTAYGDILEERGLVFNRPGYYRYRITLWLRVGPERNSHKLTSEGRIKVTGRPKGFSEMVRGLRGIVFDQLVVPYKHVKKLDSLLTELEDSPYATYVKWQRIRSYLADGQDERGYNVLEGEQADREAALLLKLSGELLAAGTDAPPIARDALTMKGIVLLLRRQEDEARKICDQLEAQYPRSQGMGKLRNWAY